MDQNRSEPGGPEKSKEISEWTRTRKSREISDLLGLRLNSIFKTRTNLNEHQISPKIGQRRIPVPDRDARDDLFQFIDPCW